MPPKPRAVLVAVHTQEQTTEHVQASLAELERLCDTVGFRVVGQVVQRRSGTASGKLLGDGKLIELAGWTGGTGVVHRGPPPKSDDERPEPAPPPPGRSEDDERLADRVVVDADLSPSQLRNLQKATGVEVLDRTGVILEIFHRNARTREARAQVELARLAYVAPRLRETGQASERQAGRGAGDTALELDRRKVRDRMAQLRKELKQIEEQRGQRRDRRRTARQVALVGYTNAGKSSLMRAITGSEPYVADQLFATLDTTVRRLVPEVVPPVLVTDTVGFIRDLPHDLVASFRSTLEAALDATLLLHVVDAADADLQRQLEVTAEVLAEVQADDIPRQLVLNKWDKLDPPKRRELVARFPDAWTTSAKEPEQVEVLHQKIVGFFASELEEAELFVPWAKAGVIGLVHGDAEVVSEDFEDDGVRYQLRVTPSALGKLRAAVE
ncbi:MAG: GTPase HflX [Myxococcota bacterium]